MTTRAERTAATRARIVDAARALLQEGQFHDASMEALATRAGVTRVTLYRAFGTKRELLEAVFWDAVTRGRLDRVDAAHAHPDVRTAVREVLRANCQMFAEFGDSLPLALELARTDPDMHAIMNGTYHGRRHRAMEGLATRIVNEGAAREGWTKKRIADALIVLTSYETFHTLIEHRGYSVGRAAQFQFQLARAFIDA